MGLVPSVEGDAAARRNTLDQGRTKYTPPGIVETHTAYRPRASQANGGYGRFGGRICPLHLHASTTTTRFFRWLASCWPLAPRDFTAPNSHSFAMKRY